MATLWCHQTWLADGKSTNYINLGLIWFNRTFIGLNVVVIFVVFSKMEKQLNIGHVSLSGWSSEGKALAFACIYSILYSV